MKFQKILSFVTLIFAALTFVYALAFMTEINPLAHYTAEKNGGAIPPEYAEIGKDPDAVYNLALKNTSVLFTVGLIFLLVSVTLFITASQKRRNYYITNFVSVIATAATAVVVAVLGIAMVAGVTASYSENIDKEAYYIMNNDTYVLNVKHDEDDYDYIVSYLKNYGFSGNDKINSEEYNELVEAGTDEAGVKLSNLYRKFVNSYGDPTFTFVIGYVLYVAVLAVGVVNVLNLLWKLKLMKGERELLANSQPAEKPEEVA